MPDAAIPITNNCFACTLRIPDGDAQMIFPNHGIGFHLSCGEAPVAPWVVRMPGSNPLICIDEAAARAEVAAIAAEGGEATCELYGDAMTRAQFETLPEHAGW